MTTTPVAILRFPTVTQRTGTPRSTILLRIKQGLFVRPVRTGPRSIGFPDDEVEALNKARIRGLGDDEIRKLVRKLERQRVGA